jgi:hypothetical protein
MTRLTLAGAFGHLDLRIVSDFTGARFCLANKWICQESGK